MQGPRNGWVRGLIGGQMNRWVEGRKERKKGGGNIVKIIMPRRIEKNIKMSS